MRTKNLEDENEYFADKIFLNFAIILPSIVAIIELFRLKMNLI